MAALDMYADLRDAKASPSRRLGALMGLPEEAGRSELALAGRVAHGLPVEAVEELVRILGRRAVIGPVVAETTYRRALKTGAPFSREVSDRVYGLSRVVDALARLYHGDRDKMRRFMDGPHMLLEGQSPLVLATSSAAGADAVVLLIEQAEAGFPV